MRNAQPGSIRNWLMAVAFILLAGAVIWVGWFSPWAKLPREVQLIYVSRH